MSEEMLPERRQAVLHRDIDRDAGWALFVYDPLRAVEDWPQHRWPTSAGIPTRVERIEVLAALGYQPAPGRGRWDWFEHQTPTGVELSADLAVTPIPPTIEGES